MRAKVTKNKELLWRLHTFSQLFQKIYCVYQEFVVILHPELEKALIKHPCDGELSYYLTLNLE